VSSSLLPTVCTVCRDKTEAKESSPANSTRETSIRIRLAEERNTTAADDGEISPGELNYSLSETNATYDTSDIEMFNETLNISYASEKIQEQSSGCWHRSGGNHIPRGISIFTNTSPFFIEPIKVYFEFLNNTCHGIFTVNSYHFERVAINNFKNNF